MANNAERHEQLMQQMANLTASLGGLTNLNPLLAQQQQTNAELSSLSTHLGGVAARIDALVAAGGVPPPSGVAGTAAAGRGVGIDTPRRRSAIRTRRRRLPIETKSS